MRAIRLLPIALVLAGCSLAPKFQTPPVAVPPAFKELAPDERGNWKTAEPGDALPRGAWWKVFGDPLLDALEDEARTSNQDLKAAAARVTASRAVLGLTSAERLPRLDGGFGAMRSQPGPMQPGLPPGTKLDPYTVLRAQVTASYEVDLFGRIADSVRAAREDVAAREALYASMELTLAADLAQTYFAARQAEAELGVLDAAVKLRAEGVRLLEKQYAAGAIGEFDLARARTELATSEADLKSLVRSRAQFEHALAVLLGRPPAEFSLSRGTLAAAPPAVPAGLPSSLLERRPDVAAAQREMAAANARIGVAKAAFFPVLNLTGAFGFESGDITDLFQWSSRTWVLGPIAGTMLAAPIFDGGRNRANLDRAYAALDESVAAYRQRVLGAFSEVEDNLVALSTLAAQSQALAVAVEQASAAAKIANVRYTAGATGYLDVLDAERTRLTVARQEQALRGARAVTTVALIRSLGGGFQSTH